MQQRSVLTFCRFVNALQSSNWTFIMARWSAFRLLTLVVFTVMVCPVGGQQEKPSIAEDQTAKSTMRKIYEENQRDRNDVEGDARRRALVRRLISEGRVQSVDDYFYAALFFNMVKNRPTISWRMSLPSPQLGRVYTVRCGSLQQHWTAICT
jgi:hypothetical protein